MIKIFAFILIFSLFACSPKLSTQNNLIGIWKPDIEKSITIAKRLLSNNQPDENKVNAQLSKMRKSLKSASMKIDSNTIKSVELGVERITKYKINDKGEVSFLTKGTWKNAFITFPQKGVMHMGEFLKVVLIRQ
jgi:hypothetical protein